MLHLCRKRPCAREVFGKTAHDEALSRAYDKNQDAKLCVQHLDRKQQDASVVDNSSMEGAHEAAAGWPSASEARAAARLTGGGRAHPVRRRVLVDTPRPPGRGMWSSRSAGS